MFPPKILSTVIKRSTLNLLCIVVLWLICIKAQGQFHRPGRHICEKQRVVQSPVREQESISQPIYQRVMVPCRSSVSGYCSTYQLTHQRTVRYVIRMQTEHQVMYTCCPGWSQYTPRDNTCLKPVCSNPCQNGGECVSPNKCLCFRQWTGSFCQTDVNECITDRHKCQHNCINTAGSYKCSCNDGFKLMNDGFSCTLCLTCSLEYKMMMDNYKQLTGRVVQLEKEKVEMHHSMSELYENLGQCVKKQRQQQQQQQQQEKNKKPSESIGNIPIDWEPVEITDKSLKSVESMIHSMSEQIGLLEEKLEQCQPEEEVSSGWI
ncbi:epidermal growth factor-like protein 7 [Argonauta hians]